MAQSDDRTDVLDDDPLICDFVKDVAQEFATRHGDDYEWKVTARWIGNVLRKKLFLSTTKSNGNFVVPRSEGRKVKHLLSVYGLADPGDNGDDGEVEGTAGEGE